MIFSIFSHNDIFLVCQFFKAFTYIEEDTRLTFSTIDEYNSCVCECPVKPVPFIATMAIEPIFASVYTLVQIMSFLSMKISTTKRKGKIGQNWTEVSQCVMEGIIIRKGKKRTLKPEAIVAPPLLLVLKLASMSKVVTLQFWSSYEFYSPLELFPRAFFNVTALASSSL